MGILVGTLMPTIMLMLKYGGRALPYDLLIDDKGKTQRAYTGLFGAGTLIQSLAQLGQPDHNPST